MMAKIGRVLAKAPWEKETDEDRRSRIAAHELRLEALDRELERTKMELNELTTDDNRGGD